jgi:transcriptional regulator with XRE-family HTH domain
MVSHRQIRAARALLGWSQQTLADKAIVSINTIGRLEAGEDMEKRGASYFRVVHALEAMNIEFLLDGEGVRFVASRQ